MEFTGIVATADPTVTVNGHDEGSKRKSAPADSNDGDENADDFHSFIASIKGTDT